MREQVEAKLKELRQSREQLVANLNATIGAIQVLEELLQTVWNPQ